jgi:hypothetical protein
MRQPPGRAKFEDLAKKYPEYLRIAKKKFNHTRWVKVLASPNQDATEHVEPSQPVKKEPWERITLKPKS